MSRTASPWLYAEISMAGLVRQRELSDYRKNITKGLTELKAFNESFGFEYDVPMGHLRNFSAGDLLAWIKMLPDPDSCSLNQLYKLKSEVESG